jgi:hypothetical protein
MACGFESSCGAETMGEENFLVYRRKDKRLFFSKTKLDDTGHLTVGRVEKGEVAGHPVEFWHKVIKAQRGGGV